MAQSPVVRNDAYFGLVAREHRAAILAGAGEPVAAIDEVERLLEQPSFLSVYALRLDPKWDPIRGHPRFKALLARHGF